MNPASSAVNQPANQAASIDFSVQPLATPPLANAAGAAGNVQQQQSQVQPLSPATIKAVAVANHSDLESVTFENGLMVVTTNIPLLDGNGVPVVDPSSNKAITEIHKESFMLMVGDEYINETAYKTNGAFKELGKRIQDETRERLKGKVQGQAAAVFKKNIQTHGTVVESMTATKTGKLWTTKMSFTDSSSAPVEKSIDKTDKEITSALNKAKKMINFQNKAKEVIKKGSKPEDFYKALSTLSSEIQNPKSSKKQAGKNVQPFAFSRKAIEDLRAKAKELWKSPKDPSLTQSLKMIQEIEGVLNPNSSSVPRSPVLPSNNASAAANPASSPQPQPQSHQQQQTQTQQQQAAAQAQQQAAAQAQQQATMVDPGSLAASAVVAAAKQREQDAAQVLGPESLGLLGVGGRDPAATEAHSADSASAALALDVLSSSTGINQFGLLAATRSDPEPDAAAIGGQDQQVQVQQSAAVVLPALGAAANPAGVAGDASQNQEQQQAPAAAPARLAAAVAMAEQNAREIGQAAEELNLSGQGPLSSSSAQPPSDANPASNAPTATAVTSPQLEESQPPSASSSNAQNASQEPEPEFFVNVVEQDEELEAAMPLSSSSAQVTPPSSQPTQAAVSPEALNKLKTDIADNVTFINGAIINKNDKKSKEIREKLTSFSRENRSWYLMIGNEKDEILHGISKLSHEDLLIIKKFTSKIKDELMYDDEE